MKSTRAMFLGAILGLFVSRTALAGDYTGPIVSMGTIRMGTTPTSRFLPWIYFGGFYWDMSGDIAVSVPSFWAVVQAAYSKGQNVHGGCTTCASYTWNGTTYWYLERLSTGP